MIHYFLLRSCRRHWQCTTSCLRATDAIGNTLLPAQKPETPLAIRYFLLRSHRHHWWYTTSYSGATDAIGDTLLPVQEPQTPFSIGDMLLPAQESQTLLAIHYVLLRSHRRHWRYATMDAIASKSWLMHLTIFGGNSSKTRQSGRGNSRCILLKWSHKISEDGWLKKIIQYN